MHRNPTREPGSLPGTYPSAPPVSVSQGSKRPSSSSSCYDARILVICKPPSVVALVLCSPQAPMCSPSTLNQTLYLEARLKILGVREELLRLGARCEGCIKINTDGSYNQEDKRGGFGGIVRTDRGKWIEGFCGFSSYGDPFRSELMGIFHGLKLCEERNYKGVTIESGCLNAVNLINMPDMEDNHPKGTIVDQCNCMKVHTESFINHIPREANHCADALAKMGANQNDAYVRLLIPPNEVLEEMACDLRGKEYGRGT